MMEGSGGDHAGANLNRSITFTTRRGGAAAAPRADAADTLMTRVFGSKNVPNQRVSESLDYEPVQNKIFYERMRQAKKERHLFGWVCNVQMAEDAVQSSMRLVGTPII